MLMAAINGQGLAQRLAGMLAERGWTPYRLAKETGLSTTYAQKLLGGFVKQPSYDTLEKLANALGTSVEDLRRDANAEQGDTRPMLGGTEDMPSWLAATFRRIGGQLTDEDWHVLNSVLEGLAARRGIPRPEDRQAFGHHAPDMPNDAENYTEGSDQKTA